MKKTNSPFREIRAVLAFLLLMMGLSESMAQNRVSVKVNASYDDIEEYVTGSLLAKYDTLSSDLEMTTEGGGQQIIGLRFAGITIPKGSLITRAYIQFRADESHSGTTNLVVKMQNSANAATYSAQLVTTRPYLADSVKWDNVPAWVTGERTEKQKTPDIKALVQQVINRADWASGNAMAFAVSGSGKRVADSWDDSEAARQPAELVIEFIAPKTASISINASTDDIEEYVTGSLIGKYDTLSSDLEMTTEGGGQQIIGLRFNNIPLPKGAIVTYAAIQFRADETHSGATNLVIKAENTDNATGYFTQLVSSRSYTTDSVSWDNIPAWTTGQRTDAQKTPDLKMLVQTIVNRSGWAANNSLAFKISGSGKRVADSWDDTEAARKPAEFIVEYFVPTAFSTPIALGFDDMEEYVNGTLLGKYDTASSDLEMTTEGGGTQTIGLRFSNILVPAGAEIREAYIQFRADETHSGATNLFIKGELSDNPVGYMTQLISTRSYTSDSISWANIPAWTTGDRGPAQKTPELKTLVQQLINRQGWTKGNPLAFRISGTGKRVADAFEDSEANKRVAELVIVYTGGEEGNTAIQRPKYPIQTYPIARNGNWKYNDLGTDLSTTNWNARKYVADTAWSFGLSKIGYGLPGLTTTLSPGTVPGAKTPTYYLRNTFYADNVANQDSIIFYANINDGAVIYVNGTEVYRHNLPTGVIGFNTLALVDPTTATGQNSFVRFVIKNSLLNFDTNTVAVELHAASGTTVGVGFEMEMFGKTATPFAVNFPFPKNSIWSASDWGQDLGTSWRTLSYDDNAWVHGNGPLGYGDPVNTKLYYGEDINNKNISIYFRKKFNVTNLSQVSDSILVSFRRDDGAVVYINNVEVIRDNMPSGAVTYTTPSGNNIISETTYFNFKLPKSVLVQGQNIVAVEIHQDNAQSSDLTFDLEMKNIFAPTTTVGKGCTGPNDTHIGCFVSVAPTTKNGYLNIPLASHKMQVLMQSGDAYSKTVTGIASMPTNNDFTGFIPENMTSSTKGHLSVNHERNFGGVSMLDLSLNAATKLWRVDTSQAIDFSPVVGTRANCSGGVTPWGTVMTAEETRSTGDANNDGYQDYGWLVEIDPRTNRIPTYGASNPQKLWAVGRASHENVVLKNDSTTLYWGEDAGDGIVYKFVANQKTNFSSGTLYAMKLDMPLSGNEPTTPNGRWIVVPNTTQSDRNNTYAIAKSLGGTTFNGIEDVEISPIDQKIYFTVKGQDRVYRFKDNGTTVSEFETYVGGQSYTFNTGTVTSEPWAEGNDNLTFDDRGNLWVLQDGGQDHIWVVMNGHTQSQPKVELFATTPTGSEPTGMTFSPDYKYMFISIQEPTGTNTPVGTDAAGRSIRFNRSTTLVIARSQDLGNNAVTSTDELSSENQVSIYPNPSEGQVIIRISSAKEGKATVEVYDITGKLVSEGVETVLNALEYREIALNIRKSGMYIVKTTTPAGSTSHKIIIK